jgi:hypothetical protein
MRSQKHNRIQGQLGLKNSRWYGVELVDYRNLLRSLHNDRFTKVDGKRISEMFLKILFPPAASFDEHAGILLDENRRILWVLNKTRVRLLLGDKILDYANTIELAGINSSKMSKRLERCTFLNDERLRMEVLQY